MNFCKISHMKRMLSLLCFAILTGCSGNANPFLSGSSSLATVPGTTTALRAVPRGAEIEVKDITIKADEDANNNSATKVDVVVAYDEHVFVDLMSMNSFNYYKRLTQLKSDYPNVVEIFTFEIIPGSSLVSQPIHLTGDNPVGAIIFSNYYSNGDHRARVGRGTHIYVHLRNNDFLVNMKEN